MRMLPSSTTWTCVWLLCVAMTRTSASDVASNTHGRHSGNPVGQMVGYVKESVTKSIQGCGQLYQNHKQCQHIRQKMKEYRQQIPRSDQYTKQQLDKLQYKAISFPEYHFLQKGKEDRGKVLNLAFLTFGAPKFLPYLLIFNKDLLPSPLKTSIPGQPPSTSTPILQLLIQVDHELQSKTNAGAGIFSLFQKKNQGEPALPQVRRQALRLLKQPGTTAAQVLQSTPGILSDTVPTRAQSRLAHIPKVLTAGMARAVAGVVQPGIMGQLTPNFLLRNQLLSHLQKIEDEDDFLTVTECDLSTIPTALLHEAGRHRLMRGDRVREQMQEWLTLTNNKDPRFNKNLCRTVLMGYYGLKGAQTDDSLLVQQVLSAAARP